MELTLDRFGDDFDVDAQDNDATARSMSSSRASSVMGSTTAVNFVQIFSVQIFVYLPNNLIYSKTKNIILLFYSKILLTISKEVFNNI